MERNRRVDRHKTSAAPDVGEIKQPPHVTSHQRKGQESSAKRKNSCSYQAQGYFPDNSNSPKTPINANQKTFHRNQNFNQPVRSNQFYLPAQQPHHARNQNPQPPRKSNPALYYIILAILLAVFLFAAYQLTAYISQSVKAKNEEHMIQEIIAENRIAATEIPQNATADNTAVPLSATPSPAPQPSAAAAITSSENVVTRVANTQPPEPEVLIQFTKALAINADTVGQLEIGESINTYVVQRDNAYYLRHSFTDEYSYSGAIFLDVSCSIYPRSRNLIIHGHNMQDGTAFGKLLRYEKISYFNQYPITKFSTLYDSAQYRPFAVTFYSINPESDQYLDIYKVNYLTDQAFIEFVQTVQLRSLYHIPINLSKNDEIITLTTCATDDPDMRFAIFAVKNEPRPF